MIKKTVLKHFSKYLQPKWEYGDVGSNFLQVESHRDRLQSILNQHSTPLFIADEEIISQRFRQLESSLNKFWKGNHIIAYSFKTNYEIARRSILKNIDVWAEVVSSHEYELAKKFNYKKKIIYNGPVKSRSSLMRAARDSALIHIDNFSELDLVSALPKKIKQAGKWGLRVSLHTQYFPHPTRFGFSLESGELLTAVKKMKTAGIPLSSFHLHPGSDIAGIKPYTISARKIVSFINQHRLNKIEYLDFGGGFPAHGKPPFGAGRWRTPSISSYIKGIANQLELIQADHKPTLIVEPGRYLVDDAIIHVTKVVDVKHQSNKQKVLVDSSITMLPIAAYRPQIIRAFSGDFLDLTTNECPTVINGATCKEDDILATVDLPHLERGDLLVFYATGAYNQSQGMDFIFPKPKHITI